MKVDFPLLRVVQGIFCIFLHGMAIHHVAYAGGALIVDRNGNPMVWEENPIPYHYDQGTLGEHSNDESRDMTDRAFQRWADIETSVLTFQNAGQLDQDITEENISEVSSSCNGFNEIIFDTDGEVINTVLGRGAALVVLGFAGPTCISTFGNVLVEGWAVLNGGFVDGKSRNGEVSFKEFESTFIHEFGHFMGLGHSQVNGYQYSNGQNIKGFESFGLPKVEDVEIMYPIAIPNDIPRPPALDDRIALSWLYPEVDFFERHGTIRGIVYRSDFQTYLQGVNLVLRNVENPLTDATSFVSGDRFPVEQTNSAPPSFEGMYHAFGLTPGASYAIEAQEVCSFFTGGSGVGPLDPPLDVAPGSCAFLEFYSDPETGHPPSDNPTSKASATVFEGEITDGIDLAINGEETTCPDDDNDGVCTDADMCPENFDPKQLDSDADGTGDGCDPCPNDALNDGDADGFCADQDNCPLISNPDQADTDEDGIGDACSCDSDEACDADEICVDKECVLEECREDLDCETTEICENRRCIAAECTSDPECEEGEICEAKRCVAGECENDSQCETTEICEGNRCVDEECQNDNDCEETQICESRRCVSGQCQNDDDCSDGSICEGNRCVDGQCSTDQDCGDGEICEGSRCKAAECAKDEDCGDAMICEAQRCETAECKTDDDCPEGNVCESGRCNSGAECERDQECESGEVCQDGVCVASNENACSSDSECNPDESCIQGQCMPQSQAEDGSSGCGCQTVSPSSGDFSLLLFTLIIWGSMRMRPKF